MSYIIEDTCIEHDGGKIGVEVEIDDDQSVIRFGNSFTLRLGMTSENNTRKRMRITLINFVEFFTVQVVN